MRAIINKWEQLPAQEGEEPGMPTFKIEGSIDGTEFSGNLSIEIDGRDMEYERLTGPDFQPDDVDRWEALLLAMTENESLNIRCIELANEYYG